MVSAWMGPWYKWKEMRIFPSLSFFLVGLLRSVLTGQFCARPTKCKWQALVCLLLVTSWVTSWVTHLVPGYCHKDGWGSRPWGKIPSRLDKTSDAHNKIELNKHRTQNAAVILQHKDIKQSHYPQLHLQPHSGSSLFSYLPLCHPPRLREKMHKNVEKNTFLNFSKVVLYMMYPIWMFLGNVSI